MVQGIALVLLVAGGVLPPAHTSTPLSALFDELRSSDPAVRSAAFKNGISVLDSEWPVIERDTALLCTTLQDTNSYMRQQAAAIYYAIITAAPEHNKVVLACSAPLMKASVDDDEIVRDDALAAVALNPAGPLSGSHGLLLNALHSRDYRYKEVGVAGLLKEKGSVATQNQAIVVSALAHASDDNTKIALLYAISGVTVQSRMLSTAVEKLLYASTPAVCKAAIGAIASSSPDKKAAMASLQSLASSSETNSEVKQLARDTVNQLSRLN